MSGRWRERGESGDNALRYHYLIRHSIDTKDDGNSMSRDQTISGRGVPANHLIITHKGSTCDPLRIFLPIGFFLESVYLNSCMCVLPPFSPSLPTPSAERKIFSSPCSFLCLDADRENVNIGQYHRLLSHMLTNSKLEVYADQDAGDWKWTNIF